MGKQILNVPATNDGKHFMELFDKFLNREHYAFIRRGRGPRDGSRQTQVSIPLEKSKWWAVYLTIAGEKGNVLAFEDKDEIKHLEEKILLQTVSLNDVKSRLSMTELSLVETTKTAMNYKHLWESQTATVVQKIEELTLMTTLADEQRVMNQGTKSALKQLTTDFEELARKSNKTKEAYSRKYLHALRDRAFTIRVASGSIVVATCIGIIVGALL